MLFERTLASFVFIKGSTLQQRFAGPDSVSVHPWMQQKGYTFWLLIKSNRLPPL